MTNDASTTPSDQLQQAHEWLLLLEDPGATEQDRRRHRAWLNADPAHADVYDQAQTFREALRRLDAEDLDAPNRQDLSRLRERVPSATRDTRPARCRGLPIALAAGIALAIVLPLVVDVGAPAAPAPIEQALETGVGQNETVQLNDGSTVTLGPSTALTATLSPKVRRIDLDRGAAFFDVVSDPARPFTVRSGDVSITVLGTAFDVRQSAGVARVAVADGEVRVRFQPSTGPGAGQDTQRRTLSAGQSVVADPAQGLSAIEAVAIDQVGAWRDGRLVYRGATLAEVVDDANRYSDRPVAFAANANDLRALTIRGSFLGADVDGLLDTLAEIHPIIVDRSAPDRITLRRR